MSLSAERAASYRRRGITPPLNPDRGSISLKALAERAKLTRRAILHHVHRQHLRVKRVATRHNWRWEVAIDEADRFLAALAAGELGNASNGRKPWKC